jgi:allantoicase
MPHTAFIGQVDLASEALGGKALLCSDDFFAEMGNLVLVSSPVFKPDLFTERGKWMDGWESRRRRVPGHDWCILQLGLRGEVRGVNIDTSHFLGNHPPYASIDACNLPPDTAPEHLRDVANWTRILTQVPLQLGAHNLFGVLEGGPWTHLRLNIYPDGGVARLRVYGRPTPDVPQGACDLAAALHGGQVLACSDMFFGEANNLLLPSRASTMGEGWESRRRRGDGHDWALIKLGTPGRIDSLELDTNHFKGNFPHEASVQGICWPDAPVLGLIDSPDWVDVQPRTRMVAHEQQHFDVASAGPYTHLRLHVFPCGGVSRFRASGRPLAPTPDEGLRALLDRGESDRFKALWRCCGSTRWAQDMVLHPFVSRAELFGRAQSIWWHLDETDWKQAFAEHPVIGGDLDALRKRFPPNMAAVSESEQAGVAGASEQVLTDLAAANAGYLKRFGYLFLIFATGKSAEQMLAALRARMHNTPENEIRVAAAEQAKITRNRLEKLL